MTIHLRVRSNNVQFRLRNSEEVNVRNIVINDEIKQNLLECFRKVAWISNDGQEYYDSLSRALNNEAELVSISAVYSGGDVEASATLDSLKTDLVVTATYDDSSTETILAYTLSGTLAVGTSTITVSYGGMTATFTVTVTKAVLYTLTTDDFARKTGNSNNASSHYYATSGGNTAQRITYLPSTEYPYSFDLLLDGGETYSFEVTSTYNTAQIGLDFYNQNVLDAVANNSNLNSSDVWTTGWLDLDDAESVAVPSTQNSSPIVGVRITFRQSSASPTISDDFVISQVIISEV